MISSWDSTRQQSGYHFDTATRDPRWDTVIGLGRFHGDWQDELNMVIERSRPTTWETRGYKGQDKAIPSADLAAEEYDLMRAGMDPKTVITHMDWDIPPVFQRMADCFEMRDTMVRIHVQKPGELWNLHIDKLQKWNPDDPSTVLRLFVQLTTWQPGQFWEFGTYHWNQWRAGDAVTFDWRNLPHSTANAGYHPRVTLQITGVRTPQTEKFLWHFRNQSEYTI